MSSAAVIAEMRTRRWPKKWLCADRMRLPGDHAASAPSSAQGGESESLANQGGAARSTGSASGRAEASSPSAAAASEFRSVIEPCSTSSLRLFHAGRGPLSYREAPPASAKTLSLARCSLRGHALMCHPDVERRMLGDSDLVSLPVNLIWSLAGGKRGSTLNPENPKP